MQVREATVAALRETRTPTLMITHDPEEAMLMADRIALMRAGRVVQEGAPDTLYRQPADAFCAGFLGEVNRLESVVRDGAVHTPLGRFTAAGLADGVAAAVLIRPEALTLESAQGVPARVLAVRSLGRSARVELALDQGLRVRARLSWRALPEAGAETRVVADPAMVFVFPAADR